MLTEKETTLIFFRTIRPFMAMEWHLARPLIIAALPDTVDPDTLDRYIDDSDRPSVSINKYGVEPKFFVHKDSKRLLEFYRSL